MKKVKSLAELATLAGVTAATASRALKDSPEIGKKTKEKIRKLAAKHNYTVNTSARNLRLQKTNTIAVILNASGNVGGDLSEQSYSTAMLGQLCDDLSLQGLDMMLSSQRSVADCWDEHFLKSKRADGIIVLGQGNDPAVLSRLAKLDTPFVVYGAYARQRSYCVIGCDSKKGGALATSHLIKDAGRKKILYLGSVGQNYEGQARIRGYEAALAEHGIPIRKERIIQCDLKVSAAASVVKQVFEEGKIDFDGIFACNDEIAIGAIQYLQSVGVNVPKDVSVVGFDDIPAASYCALPLTTIRQGRDTISSFLVDAIQGLIKGEKVKSTEIPVELVVRSSSILL